VLMSSLYLLKPVRPLGLQVLFGFILWKSKLHNVDSLC
jgi:hypothetical protein